MIFVTCYRRNRNFSPSFTALLFCWTLGLITARAQPRSTIAIPFVAPTIWLPSNIDLQQTKYVNVTACCVSNNDSEPPETCRNSDASETCAAKAVSYEPVVIGRMPQFSTEQAYDVLNQAREAWHGGSGVWTQMTLKQRCGCITNFFDKLQSMREEMVQALMWEIGKNRKDAESEVDRTAQFAAAVISAIQSSDEYSGQWQSIGSTRAFVRQAAIGIVLALAPYNYPLNECYAAVIPALLMGNIVIIKIPTTGGLVHLLTMQAFKEALPAGAIHFIAGPGRTTMPQMMETGLIDVLAFIGGSRAADQLISSHPHPHRLKVFLQLEANNMAIYLPDLFDGSASSLLDNALSEATIGSLSFNGQRCTALKLHFVPRQYAEQFVVKFVDRVQALTVGLPYQRHGVAHEYSQITPLPNTARVKYMQELIDDAVRKGAKVQNKMGGLLVGGPQSTLINPAVLYPVTPDMKVFHEEQFGPIVPVVVYDDLETVLSFGQFGKFGQQASIFGNSSTLAAAIIDRFHAVFGKINLNSQCGRSPDALPFSGRRSSAMGIMSVTHALREFSIPTVVSYKTGLDGDQLADSIQKEANFMQSV